MRSRLMIFASALGMVTVFLLSVGLAHGQNKFPNKDTATNRQDSSWGTRINEGQSYFGTDQDENAVWGHQPAAPEEPVDWYDKIIITADPNMDWPGNGQTTTTTQQSSSETGGVETTTSTSTTTSTTPNE